MPTRERVLSVLADLGDYERASEVLGVPPGQAYLIATGLPADGSDAFASDELDRPGWLPSSTQHLVTGRNKAHNPTEKPEIQAWLKHRADLDPPMRQAADERDAEPGAPIEPEEKDVATVLTRDHDRVTALMKQVKTIPGVSAGGSAVHQSRRKSIIDMITVALSRHESAEQELFWPAVRRFLPDGDEVVGKALEQEQEGKELLYALGRLEPSDERFDELASELDSALRKHVAFEDRVLLALCAATQQQERRKLGDKIARAEERAPTRPHPRAPKSPAPAVKLAGAAGAAMDRLRDNVRERPAERRGKADPEARRAADANDESET